MKNATLYAQHDSVDEMNVEQVNNYDSVIRIARQDLDILKINELDLKKRQEISGLQEQLSVIERIVFDKTPMDERVKQTFIKAYQNFLAELKKFLES